MPEQTTTDRFELASDRFMRKWGHLLVKDFPNNDLEFISDLRDLRVEIEATSDVANSN